MNEGLRSDDLSDHQLPKVDPRNRLNDLTAPEWIAETVSVFVQKGLGQGHKDAQIERQHPAPFSYQDVSRLITFFTKKGGTVIDPFCGVGSTLKACALTGRRGVGLELNPRYAELTRLRLQTELPPSLVPYEDQQVVVGDALSLVDELSPDSFDLLITSPPYWSILNKVDHKANQERVSSGLDVTYGDDPRDLANISDYADFLDRLSEFFLRSKRLIRADGHAVIIVSDFRHKDYYAMFHADLANRLREGFSLKGITILYQRHKRVFPYGYPYSYVPNIHHQYILILQKKD